MTIEVSTTAYRAQLRAWNDRVRQGEDLIITENGRPMVRVVSADGDVLLDRLEREGLLRRARPRRPSAEIPVLVAGPGDSAVDISRDRDREW